MRKLALTLSILAFSAGAAMSQQLVRIATEGAYPPFNFINDKGEIDGFERELGDELCKRMETACNWVANDWDSIIPNLTAGNYDAIIAGMTITEERKQVITFSDSYNPPQPSSYVALSADVDLQGVIAAQTTTIQANYVADTGATLLEFTTTDETVAAVRNGEADAVFGDKDFLAPLVEESNGALVFVGDDVSIGDGMGVGLRQSDEALRNEFNLAIQSMKADGSLNELIFKWFGEEGAQF